MKLNLNIWVVSDVGVINGAVDRAIPQVMNIHIGISRIPISFR